MGPWSPIQAVAGDIWYVILPIPTLKHPFLRGTKRGSGPPKSMKPAPYGKGLYRQVVYVYFFRPIQAEAKYYTLVACVNLISHPLPNSNRESAPLAPSKSPHQSVRSRIQLAYVSRTQAQLCIDYIGLIKCMKKTERSVLKSSGLDFEIERLILFRALNQFTPPM